MKSGLFYLIFFYFSNSSLIELDNEKDDNVNEVMHKCLDKTKNFLMNHIDFKEIKTEKTALFCFGVPEHMANDVCEEIIGKIEENEANKETKEMYYYRKFYDNSVQNLKYRRVYEKIDIATNVLQPREKLNSLEKNEKIESSIFEDYTKQNDDLQNTFAEENNQINLKCQNSNTPLFFTISSSLGPQRDYQVVKKQILNIVENKILKAGVIFANLMSKFKVDHKDEFLSVYNALFDKKNSVKNILADYILQLNYNDLAKTLKNFHELQFLKTTNNNTIYIKDYDSLYTPLKNSIDYINHEEWDNFVNSLDLTFKKNENRYIILSLESRHIGTVLNYFEEIQNRIAIKSDEDKFFPCLCYKITRQEIFKDNTSFLNQISVCNIDFETKKERSILDFNTISLLKYKTEDKQISISYANESKDKYTHKSKIEVKFVLESKKINRAIIWDFEIAEVRNNEYDMNIYVEGRPEEKFEGINGIVWLQTKISDFINDSFLLYLKRDHRRVYKNWIDYGFLNYNSYKFSTGFLPLCFTNRLEIYRKIFISFIDFINTMDPQCGDFHITNNGYAFEKIELTKKNILQMKFNSKEILFGFREGFLKSDIKQKNITVVDKIFSRIELLFSQKNAENSLKNLFVLRIDMDQIFHENMKIRKVKSIFFSAFNQVIINKYENNEIYNALYRILYDKESTFLTIEDAEKILRVFETENFNEENLKEILSIYIDSALKACYDFYDEKYNIDKKCEFLHKIIFIELKELIVQNLNYNVTENLKYDSKKLNLNMTLFEKNNYQEVGTLNKDFHTWHKKLVKEVS